MIYKSQNFGYPKNRTDRAPYQPPGGHQANYSALRRWVTSHATVLSCRSPIGWR